MTSALQDAIQVGDSMVPKTPKAARGCLWCLRR